MAFNPASIFFSLSLLLWAGSVAAVCPDRESAMDHHKVVAPFSDWLDLVGDTRYLGHQVERVKADNFLPAFIVSKGKVELKRPWVERVDWSAYPVGKDRTKEVRMFFDRVTDGDLLLCRIEAEVFPIDDTPRSLHRWVYLYGKGGRLEEVRRVVDGNNEASTCYQYDERGWPVTRVEEKSGDCRKASTNGAEMTFVHDDQGRLLRTISVLPNEYDFRINTFGPPVLRVQTFDDQGHPMKVFNKGWENAPFSVPSHLEANRKAGEFFVLINEELRELKLELLDRGEDWERIPWKVVRLKEGVPADILGFDDANVLEVIAEGKFKSKSVIALSTTQTQRLKDAIKLQPNNFILRTSGLRSGAIYFVESITEERWETCIDPAQRTAGACP